MEKKYYQIKTKTAEDWEIVHELLMQDGTLDDNIPHRPCECIKDFKDIPTLGTYLLDDDEAELLRNDSRIVFVALDPDFHEEVRIVCEPSSFNRFGRNVKNYRLLRRYNASAKPAADTYIAPTSNPSSSEVNRAGYQLLRCTQRDNPYSSTDAGQVVNRDINYNYDGSDVDVIVADNGVWIGHPEFVSDQWDPPNYIRGNVNTRTALCGVLDLVIDGPYYMDPDYFNADPENRLRTRWDGTITPRTGVAHQWWASPNNRSPGFSWNGSIAIPADYNRINFTGSPDDRDTRPLTNNGGDHGTPCASLVYGKNFGWAFNANKWTITLELGGSGAIPVHSYFFILKVFHEHKPINPKFGTRNPTVSSNSWNSNGSIRDSTLSSDGISWGFRGNLSSPSETGLLGGTNPIPNFIKTNSGFDSGIYRFPNHFTEYSDATLNAGAEMVNSGVIFVVSAGNNGRLVASPTSENHYNYYNRYVYSAGRRTETKTYTNRIGFPGQVGYSEGDTEYKTISVGALDDQYVGAYSEPEENDFYYARDSRQGQERLARNQELLPSYRGIDYSNRGGGVDVYAPGDGTLAATPFNTSNTSTVQVYAPRFPRYDRDWDAWFNGTSSACPVAAGIVAGIMQNNRGWNISQVKSHLRSLQENTNMWVGPVPSIANDSAWLVPFSLMGSHRRCIYESLVPNSTYNETFRPTYGLGSGSANERFTITQASGFTHSIKIWGIREFLESETTINLNIRNGYYRVGSIAITSDINLRIDPSNNRRLQLSDSNASRSSTDTSVWDDMQITATNGRFVYMGNEVLYYFSGGSVSDATSSSSASPSETISIATPSGAVPGTPGTITGASLSVTGDISANGNIFALISDERVKGNQKTIENALDKLEKLNGFTYNFNETGQKLGFDPDKRYSGVSAQEVNEVLPEAVAPAPADNDYLTVKYDKLIPLLIEAVKDLKNDIDELKDNDNK